MGVIYKLKPEVREFILETKKNDPNISCRKLAKLASEKFSSPISKSTVNSVLKSLGLSLPVGRRKRKEKGSPQRITEAIKKASREMQAQITGPAEAVRLTPPKKEEPEEKISKEEQEISQPVIEKIPPQEIPDKEVPQESKIISSEKKEEKEARENIVKEEALSQEEGKEKEEPQEGVSAGEEITPMPQEEAVVEQKKESIEEIPAPEEKVEEEKVEEEIRDITPTEEVLNEKEPEKEVAEEAGKEESEEKPEEEAPASVRDITPEKEEVKKELEPQETHPAVSAPVPEEKAKEPEVKEPEPVVEEKAKEDEELAVEETAKEPEPEKQQPIAEQEVKEEEAPSPAGLPEEKEEVPEQAKEDSAKEEKEEPPLSVTKEKQEFCEIVKFPVEQDGLGTIMLKAADYLLGGISDLTEVIKARTKIDSKVLFAKTEAILYGPIFNIELGNPIQKDSAIFSLLNCYLDSVDLSDYLTKLKQIKVVSTDIYRVISNTLQEIRGIQVSLSGQKQLYLDGQFHTSWSSPYIPYSFSSTLTEARRYIRRYFEVKEPCLMFMAPGYDIPTQEFFNFIEHLNSDENRAMRLTLYGNKLEEIETTRVSQRNKEFFICGLWPWQFTRYRKVKILSEFLPITLEELDRKIYVAEANIELKQPNINKEVTLRACLLKLSPQEKTRQVLLTNLPNESAATEDVAKRYLRHWPNLEEAFDDYSRKVELFTYTANSQRFFTTDALNLSEKVPSEVLSLFSYYLKALDLYVRWHFLPLGYEEKDFGVTKERFYNLKCRIEEKEKSLLVTFKPPSGYPYLNDLIYACNRLNEREIRLAQDKRAWFLV